MESLPASLLVYKTPQISRFSSTHLRVAAPSSENAPSSSSRQVESCHTTKPSRTGLPVCLCVFTCLSRTWPRGNFSSSHQRWNPDAGTSLGPNSHVKYDLFLKRFSFFLFQETVMNFNAVCANAKLCFFSFGVFSP